MHTLDVSDQETANAQEQSNALRGSKREHQHHDFQKRYFTQDHIAPLAATLQHLHTLRGPGHSMG